MPELIARGQNPTESWRRSPVEGDVVCLGRAPTSGWAVPWDALISREPSGQPLPHPCTTNDVLAGPAGRGAAGKWGHPFHVEGSASAGAGVALWQLAELVMVADMS